MHDLKDVDSWLATRGGTLRDDVAPDTLPDPTFTAGGRKLVSFSSNNYLSLATSPRLKAAARDAIDCYGVGNCESRLLGGNLSLYDRLEARLAEIKHKPAALLFATGYLTNLGVLPTLVKASKLARAFGYAPSTSWTHAFFTDEFSQHGDIVPLPDLLDVAERHDAVVYVDDAHGTGVLGPTGAGTSEHFG